MPLRYDFYPRGRNGDLIGYKLGDRYFVRRVPEKVKQAPATKIRSGNFAVASAAGKELRQRLHPMFPDPKNRRMQGRFLGAIAKWLEQKSVSDLLPAVDLPYVYHFSFNETTSVDLRWREHGSVKRSATGEFEFYIPSFVPVQAIHAPAYTLKISCKIMAACINFKTNYCAAGEPVTFDINYNEEPVAARVIPLSITVPEGSLFVTVASLTYLLENGTIDQRPAFLPCSIVDARFV